MIQGQMMNQPLLVSSLLRHAERHHGEQEVVSRRVEGGVHCYTYRDLAARARKMAKAMLALGMAPGDRVATLAWSSYRHMELHYAVSGAEGVLHTLNPRLHTDQLAWIVSDARSQILCFDLSFLPLLDSIVGELSGVRHFVLMSDRSHMPANTRIPGLLSYEDLCEGQDDDYEWPEFDENQASSLCYTSDTTGSLKGVLYSHRSTLLYTMASALPDVLCMSANDTVLPAVPMFHVNAWGIPYIACMVGAKLVLPGPTPDGKSLYDLIEAEGVTLTAGAHGVWQALLTHVEAKGLQFSTMRRMVAGGSACPSVLLGQFMKHGVDVLHTWGMTELSPLGTACALKPEVAALTDEQLLAIQSKQGRALFGIDMKAVDANGRELPWDGRSAGELHVRGHWVVANYLGGVDPRIDGWFPTGDVVTIDKYGYMQITDRSQDMTHRS
jgi:fatty-acyl-CoA synthase